MQGANPVRVPGGCARARLQPQRHAGTWVDAGRVVEALVGGSDIGQQRYREPYWPASTIVSFFDDG